MRYVYPASDEFPQSCGLPFRSYSQLPIHSTTSIVVTANYTKPLPGNRLEESTSQITDN